MVHDPERDGERLVFVLRATNIVETKMKRVISAFVAAPSERREFVESYLLSNATTPFAAKVKLVLFIAKSLLVKVDREAMHTLLSRRNAFAHQDHLESIRIVKDSAGRPDVAFVVESIKSSGELEAVSQAQAFAAAYATAEADLDTLLAKLGPSA